MSNVAILYCGSSFTKSLYDKIISLKARPFLMPGDTPAEEVLKIDPIAIFITGSGMAVHHPLAPSIDQGIYQCDVPVMGLCYGMQLMARDLGGQVKRMALPEKELVLLEEQEPSVLYRDFDGSGVPVWMAHVCRVTQMPPGFSNTGKTDDTSIASMEHEELGLYGVQYHPEHIGKDPSSQAGTAIIWNFLNGVCGHEVA